MTIEILGHRHAYEVECLTRVFYPGRKIAVQSEGLDGPDTITTLVEEKAPGQALVSVRVRLGEFDSRREEIVAGDPEKIERRLMILLFELLCRQTGQRPPWGTLTGVRPVRLCRELWERGKTDAEILEAMTERYLALPEKVRLCLETGRQEREILSRAEPNGFSLYISIPFCPTRCLYCSFVSHDIRRAARLLPDYLELLGEELRLTGRIARDLGLRLQTVYVGGGTPTTLEAGELKKILEIVAQNYDFSHILEYTVEAGRPDTVTPEKLSALRQGGVDRISVNPQTMDDEVLRGIGRKHTASEILEGFHMAREAGFRSINMDLIAGLPGERLEGFAQGLRQVMELRPENITVHTLAVKRASHLREQEDAFAPRPLRAAPMLDAAAGALCGGGYRPYYLYRQKGMLENLENVGYSLPGYEGVYNVLVMEEVQTVLAVGAGGVTKLCAPGVIKRVHNYKYPFEYISGFSFIRERKSKVEEFYAGYFGKKVHAY